MSTLDSHTNSTRWHTIRRGQRRRPLEWLAERAIFLVSLSTILMILLIFLFVGREALPIVFGDMNSARMQKVIPADMDKLSPGELQEYLELTPSQFANLDREALTALMEVKAEDVREGPADKDAGVNFFVTYL